ncbi:MAG: DUF4444 domain-containing protein [Pseudomonadota bacterium]
MNQAPTFPPLLRGEEVAHGQDPFAKAVAAAGLGTDPGLICWVPAEDALRAAVVLAPEEPLREAVSGIFAVTLGLGDALGALAPPEVAVHYVWPGGIKVNGADCGQLRAAASTADPATEPDWLVVGIDIAYRVDEAEPGRSPDQTCLSEEGCSEVTPERLLESWSRHMLTWINRRAGEGLAPLHAEWRSRAWGIGESLPGGGVFMGLDEYAGMLVKDDEGTHLRPLTEMLQ